MKTPLLPSLLCCAISVSLLAACGGGSDDDTTSTRSGTLDVYRDTGALQCRAGGESLPAMERRLRDAGVTVGASSCGSDGRMRTALCGDAAGSIVIFEVPHSQAAAATAAGFLPLHGLPTAVRTACTHDLLMSS